MKLLVGITKILPEWEIILSQIGVALECIKNYDMVTQNRYSVIIVTSKENQYKKHILLQYKEAGGSILIESNIAEWLFNINTYNVYINTLDPNKDSIFFGVSPGFIQTKLCLPMNGNMLEYQPGKRMIQNYNYGKGSSIIIPGNLIQLILDIKAKRINFPSFCKHLPSERVSRKSKNTIREIVQKALEQLHYIRNLPFLYLAPLPDDNKSIFGYRIDTDFASEEQIKSLYKVCLNNNITASWFIETKSVRKKMDQFYKMKNQEIGLHCFRHKILDNYNYNKIDINKGIKILLGSKLHCFGYSAPYGEWNINLGKAIEASSFIYSSEFALDYDNFPFYPYLDNYFSTVLQVPIHPICIGRLINARHNNKDIIKYYKNVIQECISHNLPIFIYDHPSLKNLNLIDWLFKYINEHNIKNYSLYEYANWWKKRLNIKWEASIYNDKIYIENKKLSSNYRLIIKKNHTEESFIDVNKEININDIIWKEKQGYKKSITPIYNRSKINRKMIINNILFTYERLKQ